MFSRVARRSVCEAQSECLTHWLAGDHATEEAAPKHEGGGRKHKSRVLARYNTSDSLFDSSFSPGRPVTMPLLKLNALVTSGPDWIWDEDDGIAGGVGVVLMFDRSTKLCTVFWHDTHIVKSTYRVGKAKDLSFLGDVGEIRGGGGKGVLKRLKSMVSVFEKSPKSRMSRSPTSRGSLGASAAGSGGGPRPRNSQFCFDAQDQTAVIFDWDDTLFPTTYAFESDDGPKLRIGPMAKQDHLSAGEKACSGRALMKCAMRVERLLRLAASLGAVSIVTLAAKNWVEKVCRFFFPGIHLLLKELDVHIVYARDFVPEEDTYQKFRSEADSNVFWSKVKGNAVRKELSRIYSNYEGQTWKNVVSIGDADFERLGTRMVMAEYAWEKAGDSGGTGCGSTGVRTKTLKMVGNPLIGDLEAQHQLLLEWLPLLVKVDGDFDASLDDLDDVGTISSIAEDLRSRQPASVMKSMPSSPLFAMSSAAMEDVGKSQDRLPEPPSPDVNEVA